MGLFSVIMIILKTLSDVDHAPVHDVRGGVWYADDMPRYRRAVVPGGTFCFTVVTDRRRTLCADPWAR